MSKVHSKDGTAIAFDTLGRVPHPLWFSRVRFLNCRRGAGEISGTRVLPTFLDRKSHRQCRAVERPWHYRNPISKHANMSILLPLVRRIGERPN